MAHETLRLERISKKFKVSRGIFRQAAWLRAVDDVSIRIGEGESLGLVGESGCGKSTLGKISCGLLKPSSGEILLHGRALPPAGAKSWAAGKVQMVFQDPASSLDPRMTILDSIAEPLIIKGGGRGGRLERAQALLEAVGLGGLGDRYPHQFSGGQRQRIAVARALATNPSLVICDEPVSALDASVQAQILNLLKDMREERNPSYLFISHDLAVIGFMCSRIMVMYLGQIVEEARAERLFRHAAHPYTLALIAAMPKGERNWKEGEDLGALPPPLSGELPSPISPPSGCYFHPRCPRAQDICRKEPPPWKDLGPDWRARCFFPEISEENEFPKLVF